jgi:ATP-dependent helicase/DNAse subunit B
MEAKLWFMVLCGLALCLMTYAAMAIGQSFKKNKGLMSVVFFFVLHDQSKSTVNNATM